MVKRITERPPPPPPPPPREAAPAAKKAEANTAQAPKKAEVNTVQAPKPGATETAAAPRQVADGFETKAPRTPGTRDTGVEAPTQPTPAPAPSPGKLDDSDPMKHITYLASDELQGRDTPSTGLNAAAAYVTKFAQDYGLKGPNSLNPSDPYAQPFNLFSFAGPESLSGDAARGGHAGHAEHKEFGHTLFQEGFYLDEKMPAETREVLTRQYQDSMKEAGWPLAQRSTEPMSVEELRQVARPEATTQNTMALLEGTGPHKGEVLVVMAHLDHVGTSRGKVNNGADDNASGSAVLMSSIPELVEAQKRGELDRSVLFVWTAGEEKGLVGSQYFVDHPIPGLGLDKISGVVNVDMVGRWDDQRLSVVDTNSRGKPNYFREVVTQANAQMADPFDRINQDINMYRDRQDGAVFSRKGEDVLFMFEGLSNPKGGGDLIPEYHQPTDDVDKILRDNGGEKPRRIKDLMVNVLKLAANREAPAPTP